MSIPLLSFLTSPSFIASSGDADRLRNDDLPCPSPSSPITGVHMLNKSESAFTSLIVFQKQEIRIFGVTAFPSFAVIDMSFGHSNRNKIGARDHHRG
jgi:hypothetical protein